MEKREEDKNTKGLEYVKTGGRKEENDRNEKSKSNRREKNAKEREGEDTIRYKKQIRESESGYTHRESSGRGVVSVGERLKYPGRGRSTGERESLA